MNGPMVIPAKRNECWRCFFYDYDPFWEEGICQLKGNETRWGIHDKDCGTRTAKCIAAYPHGGTVTITPNAEEVKP